jgi:rhodanese-related sulfurtransferase
MRHSVGSLLIALSLVACGGSSAQSAEATATESTSGSETQQASFRQIGVDEVASALETQPSSIAVFDANSAQTYAEHHIPGAVWVDYDAVAAEQLPENRETQLVFYCANEQCSASHVAAETAHSLGYENVAVMGAGIQGWIAAGKPVETASATAAAE